MKNIIKAILLIILISTSALGQNTVAEKGSRVLLSTSQDLSNVSFYVYTPPFSAKAIYKDTAEATNKFPEQLMSSVISATSQQWIYYNTLNGKEKAEKKEQKYFDYIKYMDKDKNYFELRSKLSFSLNSSYFTIIKFYFHIQELPKTQTGAYVMQQVNGRWYLTSNSNTSDIALMVMRFQEEKLLYLLKAKPIGDKLMDDLIKLVAKNESIDFTLLYNEFSSWYDKNESQKIDYFIDKNAW